ncbi:MAG TPA: PP0621 family protein [Pseudomonadales bacterium]|nr:PP0621 family protein [Pseudomonadales bacterium]HNC70056.1 PP0621 family protein [Pseudomonadales bacterium]
MLLFRLLLLFAMAFIAWRIYRLLTMPRVPGKERTQRLRGAEDMAECTLCALRVPRSQAIATGDRWYCCEDHWRQGERSRRSNDA